MLQRFYFDLKEGFSFIRDSEGVEAPSLDQAAEEARLVIKEMLGNEELSADDAGWLLIIRDAAGETLLTMPIVEPGQP